MHKNEITGYLSHKTNRPYWFLVICYHDESGKRHKIWESTKIPYPGNKRQAQAYMRERLETINRNTGKAINLDMTVVELTEVWLENVKNRVRANSYERYTLNAAKIIDYYKAHNIKVINYVRTDAKIFFNHLLSHGKINPKTGKKEPLSATSVRDIKVILKMIFDEAIDANIIKINPIEGIKITTSTTVSSETTKYMDRTTAENFIKFCREKDDVLTDVIVAAIAFGLRRSEILGLRYSDINLDEQYINISHTITRTATLHIENNTKNRSSARTIPITDAEVAFFADILARKAENKKYFSSMYTDTDYIFTWEDGRPFNPDFLTKHTKILLKAFGEPELHFHSFRHTFASIQHELGVDLLEIQRLMGHAPGSDVTLGIYTHINRKKAEPHSTGLIK